MTMPELDQPLMVVVLVMFTRAAARAGAAGAVFRRNERATNIGANYSGSCFFGQLA